MPIPHLQHKIHSPNEWEKKKPSKILSRTGEKNDRRFFDIKWIPKENGKLDLKATIKKLWPYALTLCLVCLIGTLGLFAWVSKDLPDPNKLSTRSVAQSTKIYDRTGEHLLYEIHGDQKRTLIPIDQIPKYAIQATITLEDQKFYEHSGFSILGIIRGVIVQALKGKRLEGGSTLTQQLVKNAVLSNERSITRKIKELILSYRLEQKYSKDEILQMYFNEIPYGSTAYGIESAAQTYFGKSAKDLTLAEAAALASLPQAPTYYYNHQDALIGRQQYALDQMVKLGYITEDQAKAAKEEKIVFKPLNQGIVAPHFVFFVKEMLSQKYGETIVDSGGLKIISTLDYDLQTQTEQIVKDQVEKNAKTFQANNAAVVVIDIKTGQILAMVGSADFFNEDIDGQVNVATSPRQPGSSFKPIVYTAGFAKGYVPETTLYDVETHFKTEVGDDYFPHDYDLKERGPVSIRTALAGSLNIPAVKMIYLAGIDNVLNLADDLGYTTLKNRSRFGLSLVLGGGEVSLLEHTNAYATFAREGTKLPYSAVLKLEQPDGQIMEEYQDANPQKVIDPNIVNMTSSILSDNNARSYVFGASNYLTLSDRPVAAKTGTTNDYHDAWTLGYTPQIAVGVWTGNSNNEEMKRGADGSQIAAPIWQKVMAAAVKNLPVQGFTAPSYQIPNKPMLGGDAYGVKIKINKINGLLASDNTPAELIEEKTFKQTHSILQYVNKEDPLGPAPENPSADPYYQSWEDAVQAWAQKNNITSDPLPTEFDTGSYDLSQDASATVFWSAPQNDEIIHSNNFPYSLKLNLTDAAKIQKIDVFIKTTNAENSTWINFIEKPQTFDIILPWNNAPASGDWIIYPLVTDIYGRTAAGQERRIKIE